MVEDFEELGYVLSKKTVTPTIKHLFKMNDNIRKLDKEIEKNISHLHCKISILI